ncbi:MAG: peptidoglycan DD-metalloendopeptidase family protein, partial [Alphaproteobacteria bacterium]
APVKPQLVARTGTGAPGGVHVVQPGDTLFSIARRYGARVDDLSTLNNLQSAAHIRIGQRLRIDGSARPSAANSAFAAAKPIPATLQPAKLSATTTTQHTAKKPVITAAAPNLPAVPAVPVVSAAETNSKIAAIDSAADPASVNGTSFRWPVRGRIISGFGGKVGGTRNDGINLAVPEGTSVKATEAGKVIYAGNELEGYGELVLIRHADGWVSAYAHNKQIKVKKGDTVRRGQTVALAGRSGSVSSPQVHFELRRGAKPVNPLDHLTGA